MNEVSNSIAPVSYDEVGRMTKWEQAVQNQHRTMIKWENDEVRGRG